jgi:hypothetical protein
MSFNITVDQTKLQAKAAKERIAELKQLLRDSDFRMLPDYKVRSGMTDNEYNAIVAQRKSWYDELKSLEP